jgi:hypothetical protein
MIGAVPPILFYASVAWMGTTLILHVFTRYDVNLSEVHSASKKNEYHEYFLVVQAAGT